MRYVVALIIALSVPTAALAEDPCSGDKEKFCEGVGARPGKIWPCLRKHEGELSESCKAELKTRDQEWRARGNAPAPSDGAKNQ
jgi:hypothetical protein